MCPQCQGRGVEAEGQGLFSISQPCSRCGGSGAVIDDPCPTCSGSGAVRANKRYRVRIPAGVREGSRIRLPGKGEPGLQGGEPGDLYVVTHVADSPIFTRAGDNVEVEVPLTIPEAIRGATVEVPTLNGRKRLRVKPGTQHGTLQRLRGEGPPKLHGLGSRGHPLPLRDRRAGDAVAAGAREGRRARRRDAGRRPARQAVRRDHRERRLMAVRRVRTTTTRVEVSSERGVFMISVAAELADMHPQTLRMYEQRGLIEPQRSPKGTRLYSHADVERLQRIQELTDLGMNLAGVERVFELEDQLERAQRKVALLERRAAQLSEEVARLEALRSELRAEIVPYVKAGSLVRREDCEPLG